MEAVTEEELKLAAELKAAAEQEPGLDTEAILDLEFLQFSISAKVAKRNTTETIRRMKRLQAFKAKYGINGHGSFEQGMRDLKTFQEAHPGMLLSIKCLGNGVHLFTANFANFLERKIGTQESVAVILRGFYYMFQVCQPRVESMRAGVQALADANGVGWKNFSLRVEEQAASLYAHSYPVNAISLVTMNSSLFLRFMFHLSKLFLPRELAKRQRFAGELNEHLKQSDFDETVLPVEWGGKNDYETLQRDIERQLQEHYDLAANFKL